MHNDLHWLQIFWVVKEKSQGCWCEDQGIETLCPDKLRCENYFAELHSTYCKLTQTMQVISGFNALKKKHRTASFISFISYKNTLSVFQLATFFHFPEFIWLLNTAGIMSRSSMLSTAWRMQL